MSHGCVTDVYMSMCGSYKMAPGGGRWIGVGVGAGELGRGQAVWASQ